MVMISVPVSDIFKSNFLNNLNAVTTLDMALAVALAFGMGCFIFLVYARVNRGVMYSESFGFTLAALTAITTVLMLAVTSNVMLSLGMVGALSIVRFRTAIKEPMEIVFLFWSVETGIVLAAGILPLAIGANIAVGIFLAVFLNWKQNRKPYILVLRCDQDQYESACKILEENKIHFDDKAITPIPSDNPESQKSDEPESFKIEAELEIILLNRTGTPGKGKKNGSKEEQPPEEERISDPNELLKELREKVKIPDVALVSYNGSYMQR